MSVLFKYLIIALVVKVLVIVSSFSDQNVYLHIYAPNEVEAGTTIDVEIELHKANLSGFARFQQELPYGVTASPVYPADMNFSFEDNKLNMIWLSLPDEEITNIRYRLHINERLKGDLNLEGIFSYIENNQRKSADAPGMMLTINQSPDIEESMVVDVNRAREILVSPVPVIDPGVNVFAVRQEPVPDNDLGYIVNILVNKGDKNHFAKIEETIPDGFTAIEIDSKDGIFSFSNQTARIIWRNLPIESNFLVSYRLVPHEGVEETPELRGEFSFMQNDITASRQIVERDANLTALEDAERQRLIASIPRESVRSLPATPVRTHRPAARPHIGLAVTDDPARPIARPGVEITNPLVPEQGVYYRVQLAAGRIKIDPVSYFGRLNIERDVRAEIHEGWIKYSVGSFTDYRSARDYRVEVWNNTPVFDAFVAAYNDGRRITVQEALVIANHQWYR